MQRLELGGLSHARVHIAMFAHMSWINTFVSPSQLLENGWRMAGLVAKPITVWDDFRLWRVRLVVCCDQNHAPIPVHSDGLIPSLRDCGRVSREDSRPSRPWPFSSRIFHAGLFPVHGRGSTSARSPCNEAQPPANECADAPLTWVMSRAAHRFLEEACRPNTF